METKSIRKNIKLSENMNTMTLTKNQLSVATAVQFSEPYIRQMIRATVIQRRVTFNYMLNTYLSDNCYAIEITQVFPEIDDFHHKEEPNHKFPTLKDINYLSCFRLRHYSASKPSIQSTSPSLEDTKNHTHYEMYSI